MTTIHPRFGPRRGSVRATSWWGRAWVRAIEEAAYAEGDLRAARALARSGRLGSLGVSPGEFAVVLSDHETASVHASVPQLDERDRTAFVSIVAAEAGRIAALLGGELPHGLVEHLEEAGVELLPYGGELGWTCTCEGWLDPCVHALAAGYQVGWLLDADPWALIELRGLPRDTVLARLHDLQDRVGETPTDEDVALDAARRARRIVHLWHTESAESVDHLL